MNLENFTQLIRFFNNLLALLFYLSLIICSFIVVFGKVTSEQKNIISNVAFYIIISVIIGLFTIEIIYRVWCKCKNYQTLPYSERVC